MRNRWKRVCAGTLAAVLLLSLMPATALAAAGEAVGEAITQVRAARQTMTSAPFDTTGMTVLYIDKGPVTINAGSIVGKDENGASVTEVNPKGYVITQVNPAAATSNTVSVNNSCTLVFQNVNISSAANYSPVSVSNATLKMYIEGINNMNGNGYGNAIRMNAGASLKLDAVNGDQDVLNATQSGTGNSYSISVIGPCYGNVTTGSVTVRGGTYNLKGSVGIGTSYYSNSNYTNKMGNINIQGGVINGIGCGTTLGANYCDSVYAPGAYIYQTCGTINITGGEVNAVGSGNRAAIGASAGRNTYCVSRCLGINISGGKVTILSKGIALGGGWNDSGSRSINLTGGEIYAEGVTGANGAWYNYGVVGGYLYVNGTGPNPWKTVTVEPDCKLTIVDRGSRAQLFGAGVNSCPSGLPGGLAVRSSNSTNLNVNGGLKLFNTATGERTTPEARITSSPYYALYMQVPSGEYRVYQPGDGRYAVFGNKADGTENSKLIIAGSPQPKVYDWNPSSLSGLFNLDLREGHIQITKDGARQSQSPTFNEDHCPFNPDSIGTTYKIYQSQPSSPSGAVIDPSVPYTVELQGSAGTPYQLTLNGLDVETGPERPTPVEINGLPGDGGKLALVLQGNTSLQASGAAPAFDASGYPMSIGVTGTNLSVVSPEGEAIKTGGSLGFSGGALVQAIPGPGKIGMAINGLLTLDNSVRLEVAYQRPAGQVSDETHRPVTYLGDLQGNGTLFHGVVAEDSVSAEARTFTMKNAANGIYNVKMPANYNEFMISCAQSTYRIYGEDGNAWSSGGLDKNLVMPANSIGVAKYSDLKPYENPDQLTLYLSKGHIKFVDGGYIQSLVPGSEGGFDGLKPKPLPKDATGNTLPVTIKQKMDNEGADKDTTVNSILFEGSTGFTGTYNVTLSGVNIDTSPRGAGKNFSPIRLHNGVKVNMTLATGTSNTLNPSNNGASVVVRKGTSLTLDGDGSLACITYGRSGAGGIGAENTSTEYAGGTAGAYGDITIKSGDYMLRTNYAALGAYASNAPAGNGRIKLDGGTFYLTATNGQAISAGSANAGTVTILKEADVTAFSGSKGTGAIEETAVSPATTAYILRAIYSGAATADAGTNLMLTSGQQEYQVAFPSQTNAAYGGIVKTVEPGSYSLYHQRSNCYLAYPNATGSFFETVDAPGLSAHNTWVQSKVSPVLIDLSNGYIEIGGEGWRQNKDKSALASQPWNPAAVTDYSIIQTGGGTVPYTITATGGTPSLTLLNGVNVAAVGSDIPISTNGTGAPDFLSVTVAANAAVSLGSEGGPSIQANRLSITQQTGASLLLTTRSTGKKAIATASGGLEAGSASMFQGSFASALDGAVTLWVTSPDDSHWDITPEAGTTAFAAFAPAGNYYRLYQAGGYSFYEDEAGKPVFPKSDTPLTSAVGLKLPAASGDINMSMGHLRIKDAGYQRSLTLAGLENAPLIPWTGDYSLSQYNPEAAVRYTVQVTEQDSHNILLKGVNLNPTLNAAAAEKNVPAFDMAKGAAAVVTLEKASASVFTGGSKSAGIHVPYNNPDDQTSLTIKADLNSGDQSKGAAQGTGSLTANGGEYATGIGGSYNAGSAVEGIGSLTIEGGAVTAVKGSGDGRSPDIGSSGLGANAGIILTPSGRVAVTGGTVTGVINLYSGEIDLTGGTVKAVVPILQGAAIGSGYCYGTSLDQSAVQNLPFTIHIGGTAQVTAVSKSDAAAIGGGHTANANYSVRKTPDITIDGDAVVNAKGGSFGAGIGGSVTCSGGNITIGGSAQVTANGGETTDSKYYPGGVGIGGGTSYIAGYPSGSSGIIIIKDSARVAAAGGYASAGIGGGTSFYSSNVAGKLDSIIIQDNAEVNATGDYTGRGIGGGYGTTTEGDCGPVKILSTPASNQGYPKVTAVNGIGGGGWRNANSAGGKLESFTMTGGTLNASIPSANAMIGAAIGSGASTGKSGDVGSVSITGNSVVNASIAVGYGAAIGVGYAPGTLGQLPRVTIGPAAQVTAYSSVGSDILPAISAAGGILEAGSGQVLQGMFKTAPAGSLDFQLKSGNTKISLTAPSGAYHFARTVPAGTWTVETTAGARYQDSGEATEWEVSQGGLKYVTGLELSSVTGDINLSNGYVKITADGYYQSKKPDFAGAQLRPYNGAYTITGGAEGYTVAIETGANVTLKDVTVDAEKKTGTAAVPLRVTAGADQTATVLFQGKTNLKAGADADVISLESGGLKLRSSGGSLTAVSSGTGAALAGGSIYLDPGLDFTAYTGGAQAIQAAQLAGSACVLSGVFREAMSETSDTAFTLYHNIKGDSGSYRLSMPAGGRGFAKTVLPGDYRIFEDGDLLYYAQGAEPETTVFTAEMGKGAGLADLFKTKWGIGYIDLAQGYVEISAAGYRQSTDPTFNGGTMAYLPMPASNGRPVTLYQENPETATRYTVSVSGGGSAAMPRKLRLDSALNIDASAAGGPSGVGANVTTAFGATQSSQYLTVDLQGHDVSLKSGGSSPAMLLGASSYVTLTGPGHMTAAAGTGAAAVGGSGTSPAGRLTLSGAQIPELTAYSDGNVPAVWVSDLSGGTVLNGVFSDPVSRDGPAQIHAADVAQDIDYQLTLPENYLGFAQTVAAGTYNVFQEPARKFYRDNQDDTDFDCKAAGVKTCQGLTLSDAGLGRLDLARGNILITEEGYRQSTDPNLWGARLIRFTGDYTITQSESGTATGYTVRVADGDYGGFGGGSGTLAIDLSGVNVNTSAVNRIPLEMESGRGTGGGLTVDLKVTGTLRGGSGQPGVKAGEGVKLNLSGSGTVSGGAGKAAVTVQEDVTAAGTLQLIGGAGGGAGLQSEEGRILVKEKAALTAAGGSEAPALWGAEGVTIQRGAMVTATGGRGKSALVSGAAGAGRSFGEGPVTVEPGAAVLAFASGADVPPFTMKSPAAPVFDGAFLRPFSAAHTVHLASTDPSAAAASDSYDVTLPADYSRFSRTVGGGVYQVKENAQLLYEDREQKTSFEVPSAGGAVSFEGLKLQGSPITGFVYLDRNYSKTMDVGPGADAGLGGLTVTLYDSTGSSAVINQKGQEVKAVTEADGSYVLLAPEPGRYVIGLSLSETEGRVPCDKGPDSILNPATEKSDPVAAGLDPTPDQNIGLKDKVSFTASLPGQTDPVSRTQVNIRGTALLELRLSPSYLNGEVTVHPDVVNPKASVPEEMKQYISVSAGGGLVTIAGQGKATGENAPAEFTLSLPDQQGGAATLVIQVDAVGNAVQASLEEKEFYASVPFEAEELRKGVRFYGMGPGDTADSLSQALTLSRVQKQTGPDSLVDVTDPSLWTGGGAFGSGDVGRYVLTWQAESASGQNIEDVRGGAVQQTVYVHGYPYLTVTEPFHSRAGESFDPLKNKDGSPVEAAHLHAGADGSVSVETLSGEQLLLRGYKAYRTDGTDPEGKPGGMLTSGAPTEPGKYQIVYGVRSHRGTSLLEVSRDLYVHSSPSLRAAGYLGLGPDADKTVYTEKEIAQKLWSGELVKMEPLIHVNENGSLTTYGRGDIDVTAVTGGTETQGRPIRVTLDESGQIYIKEIRNGAGETLADKAIPNTPGTYTMTVVFADNIDGLGEPGLTGWEAGKDAAYQKGGTGYFETELSIQVLGTDNRPSVPASPSGRFVTGDSTRFTRTVTETSAVSALLNRESVSLPYEGKLYTYTADPAGNLSVPELLLELVRYDQTHDADLHQNGMNKTVHDQGLAAMMDAMRITKLKVRYPDGSEAEAGYTDKAQVETDFAGAGAAGGSGGGLSPGLLGAVCETPGVYSLTIRVPDVKVTHSEDPAAPDGGWSFTLDDSEGRAVDAVFTLTVSAGVTFSRPEGSGQFYTADGVSHAAAPLAASYVDGLLGERELAVSTPGAAEAAAGSDPQLLDYSATHPVITTLPTTRPETVHAYDKAFLNGKAKLTGVPAGTVYAVAGEPVDLLLNGTVKGSVDKFTNVTGTGKELAGTWSTDVSLPVSVRAGSVPIESGLTQYIYPAGAGRVSLTYEASDGDTVYQNGPNTAAASVDYLFSTRPEIRFTGSVPVTGGPEGYTALVLDTDDPASLAAKLGASAFYIDGDSPGRSTQAELGFVYDAASDAMIYTAENPYGAQTEAVVKLTRQTAPVIRVRAVGTDGGVLNGSLLLITEGLTIGERCRVAAPAYAGYELAEGETATKDILVQEGENTVDFCYKKAGGAAGFTVRFVTGEGGAFAPGAVTMLSGIEPGLSIGGYGYPVPEVTPAPGYKTAYWYDVSTDPTAEENRLTPEQVKARAVTGDTTFRAVFMRTDGPVPEKAWRVTFQSDGNGTLDGVKTDIAVYVPDGETLDRLVPVTAADPEHLFDGWSRNGAEGEKVSAVSQEIITADSLYYAHFPTIGEVVEGSFITVTVEGQTADYPAQSLYSYQVTINKEETEPHILAQEVYGYEFKHGASSDSRDSVNGENPRRMDLDGLDQDRTVTYTYQTRQRDILLLAVDEHDQPIEGYTPLKVTGLYDPAHPQTVTVNAPILDGWVLAEGQSSSREHVVREADNSVIFRYQPLKGNVLIVMQDEHTGSIIGNESFTLSSTDREKAVPIPDLTEQGWTAVSGQKEQKLSYQSGLQRVVYRYEKDVRDVVLHHYLEGSTEKIQEDTTLLKAARVGEFYTVQPPVVPNYTAKSPAYNQKVEKGTAPLAVSFYYIRNEQKAVSVTYETADGAALADPDSIQAAVGAQVTAHARSIPGYTVKGDAARTVTVSADDKANVIRFVYEKTGYEITVRTQLGDGPVTTAYTVAVDKGESRSIPVPYAAGYVADGFSLSSLSGGAWQPVDPTDTDFRQVNVSPSDNGDVILTFHYITLNEAAGGQFVTVNVTGVDGAGTELYRYSLSLNRQTPDEQAFIQVNDIPGYELKSLALTGEGGAGTASVENRTFTFAPGSLKDIVKPQTLTAVYSDLSREIAVKAVLEEGSGSGGNPVPGYTQRTVRGTAGQTITVPAPVIQGYVLAAGQSSSVNYQATEAAAQSVTFSYRPMEGNVTVVLREGTKENPGRVIEMRDGGTLSKESSPLTVDIPDLSAEYYTAVSAVPAVLTFQEETAPEPVTYYYTKQTCSVTMIHVIGDTQERVPGLADGTETARLGEAFTAAAPARVPNYTLSGSSVQTIVPEGDAVVPFSYTANPQKLVTVRHLVQPGGEELGREEIYAAEGGKVTARAGNFPGYTLSSPTETKTHVVTGEDGQSICFDYQKTGYQITVQVMRSDGASAETVSAVMADKGESRTIPVPYVAGYVLTGYDLDGGTVVPVLGGGTITEVRVDAAGSPNRDRTLTFHYIPFNDAAQGQFTDVTVTGVDEEGVTLYQYTLTLNKDTGSRVVTAQAAPGYQLTGGEGGSFDPQAGTVTLDSLNEPQSVTFRYSGLDRSVRVNAWLGETGETPVPGYGAAVTLKGRVGDVLSVAAPVIPGYVLLDGQSMNVSCTVTDRADQHVDFRYRAAQGNVVIRLWEKDTDLLLRVDDMTIPYGQTGVSAPIPDLSAQGYTPVEKSPKELNYQEGIQYVDYHYVKDTRDVEVKYLCGGEEIRPADHAYGAARVGETCRLDAPDITGYTALNPHFSQVVQAGTDPLEITFTYKQNSQKTVRVEYRCQDTLLGSDTLQAAAGSVVTAAAKSFPGYTVQGEDTVRFTVTDNDSTNQIIFQYARTGYAVSVMTRKGDGAPEQAGDPVMVNAGGEATISAPYLPGYALTGYTWGTERVDFTEPNEQTSVTRIPEADTTLTFRYKTNDEIMQEAYITVTVVNRDAAGAVLNQYSTQVNKKTGDKVIHAQDIPGCELVSGTGGDFSLTDKTVTLADLKTDQTVTFTYRLKGGEGGGCTVRFVSGPHGSLTGPDVNPNGTMEYLHVTYGSTLAQHGYALPESSPMSGYEFYKWLDTSDGACYDPADVSQLSIERDRTFLALFKENGGSDPEIVPVRFTVEGRGSFGNGVTDQTLYFAAGDALGTLVPEPVSETTSVFTGWYRAEAEVADMAAEQAEQDAVYTARFADDYNKDRIPDEKQTVYTVTFTAASGGSVEERRYEVVEHASLSDYGYAAPTPKPGDGFGFAYWYDAKDDPGEEAVRMGSGALLALRPITADTVYVAVFKGDSAPQPPVQAHRVDFAVTEQGGGALQGPSPVYVLDGELLGALAPKAVPDEGYVLKEWTKDSPEGKKISDPATERIAADARYYARFATLDEVVAGSYVTIEVRGEDETGTELYAYRVRRDKEGEELEIPAQSVPYYALAGGQGSQGGVFDLGAGTLTLPGLESDQTVTFTYENLERTVSIKAQAAGEEGEILQTQTMQGFKGTELTVHAPAVEGYVLVPDGYMPGPEETLMPKPELPAPTPEETVPEPDITAPESDSSEPEPDVTTPEPDSSEPEPDVTAPEPDSSEPEPDVTTPEPDSSKPEPNVTTPESDSSKPEPNVTTPEPDSSEPEPDVITPDPQPDVTTPESDNSSQEPDVTTSESDNSKPEPDVTTSEPDNSSQEPDITTSESDNSNPEPDVTTSESDNSKPESDVTTPEPDGSSPTPDMAAPKADGNVPAAKAAGMQREAGTALSAAATADLFTALADSQSVSSSRTITVGDTEEENTVVFTYKPITGNVVLKLVEKDSRPEQIIELQEMTLSPGDTGVEIPVPRLDGWTIQSSPETLSYSSDRQTVTYEYSRPTRPVTLKYLEEGTERPLKEEASRTARVGETYIATADPIDGYVVVGEAAWSGTVQAAGAPLVISFHYRKLNDQKPVSYTVEYRFEDRPLQTFHMVGLAGAEAGYPAPEQFIQGSFQYTLNPADQGKTIRLDENPDKNVLVFRYDRTEVEQIAAYTVYYDFGGTHIRTNSFTAAAGSTVSHTAPGSFVEGDYKYTLKDDAVKSLTLTADTAGNTLTFQYTREKFNPGTGGGGGGGGGGGTVVVTEYTVTYSEGLYGELTGQGSESVEKGGKPAHVPEITAHEGYAFEGWSVDKKNLVDPKTVVIQKNTVFLAMYQKGDGPLIPGDQITDISQVPQLNKADHMAYLFGDASGTFRPDGPMTRAEVVAMFTNLLKDPMPRDFAFETAFPDVAQTAWYAPAVAYLEQFGVINGYPDGTFRPEAPVTRAEFMAIAFRFSQLELTDQNFFPDVPADYWAAVYINSAYLKGWISGDENGRFEPERNIRRAEAASIVNRMLERTPDKSYIDAHREELRQFPDLTDSHWAYYEIMEAVNSHQYRRENGRETWTAQ